MATLGLAATSICLFIYLRKEIFFCGVLSVFHAELVRFLKLSQKVLL